METGPKNYAVVKEKDVFHWYLLLALCVVLGICTGGYFLFSHFVSSPSKMTQVRQGLGGNFSSFFRAHGIDPVDPAQIDKQIADGLLALEKNLCDWPLTDKIGGIFLLKNEKRAAANIYLRFAQSCPSDETAEQNAAVLFYDIQDYGKARTLFTHLTERFPDNELLWYHRGQAEHHLGMINQALQSFANTLLLTKDPKIIGEWFFTELSTVYAEAKRFCEAMTPIATYVSLDPGTRDNARAHTMLANLAKQGNCASFAEGRDIFPVSNPASIVVRGTVNGIAGTFLVDTGASFVALNKGFAQRAKIVGETNESFATANGETRGSISRANRVQLGKLKADDVPVVIMPSQIKGVDGLLGQSFLSRFEMTLTASQLSLATRQTE